MPILTDMLKEQEGYVGHAYQDSKGYWTIGYGRMIDERLGGHITKKEAEYLLENDIGRAEAELNNSFSWFLCLPYNVQNGLINMNVNMGLPRLKTFKKMLLAISVGDYTEAAKQALDSKWRKDVGEDRALAVAKLIRNE
ncbi:MAG: glycoside hydrolase family protein [bacterium]